MRNANKSPKIPCIAMAREVEVESVSGTGSLPKVNKFFRLVSQITTPISFNEFG